MSPSVIVVKALEQALLTFPGLEFTIRSNTNGEFFVVAHHLGVFVGSSKESSLAAAIQELLRSLSLDKFF
jgi:hypothetical protein